MKARTEPVDLSAKRRERSAKLEAVLTPEQIRRRAVTKLRHNLAMLADDEFDEVKRQLELVALVDGPKAYIELYLKMLEFAVPKLSRAEVSVEDGGKTATAEMSMDELQALVREGIAAKEQEARTIEGECEDASKDARDV